MVQLFYYENRGKCYKKLFKHDGFPCRVLLFPFEGWAEAALISHWVLNRTTWWPCRKRCKIVEYTGTHKFSTMAKLFDKGNGNMVLKGKFKSSPNPDFVLRLSTNVTFPDFQKGYSFTGTLERGNKRKGKLQLTHFAMIKRKGY